MASASEKYDSKAVTVEEGDKPATIPPTPEELQAVKKLIEKRKKEIRANDRT